MKNLKNISKLAMNKNNLIWIDLEMTGLNPENDVIIEIATVVTDKNLNIISTGPSLAINQSDKYLDNMDSWNTNQHNNSGLIKRVIKSDISVTQAEKQTLEFLSKYVKKGISPMCGNTVSQDRRFLYKYMPKLEKFFHYRHIDVSTLKHLCSLWSPNIAKSIKKESKHLALDDVFDSIQELKYYRKNFINE